MTDTDILLAARKDPAHRPAGLPHAPADQAAAYAIQAAVMAHLGPIGGWKVGFSPASSVFTCAPLPASFVVPGPATVPQHQCPDRGVEAEIAVRIGADLPPRATPYTRAEVLAAIASAHPAIELLQSRYSDVDAVDPLTALADSLSHFGLVVGAAIPDWQSIDLAHEGVSVMVNGAEIKRCAGNPAGEMVRLVEWLANVGTHWAGGLKAGQVVTTGSWTVKDIVPANAHVKMVFDHCGSVEATYA
jgi:2-keto-4-pentenoate hydratase